MRILSIIGTRPEAIKMAPIALSAATRSNIEHILVTTGQHGRLIDQALDGFGVTRDVDLALGRVAGPLASQIARIRAAAGKLIAEMRPDLVLVQGDTTSARAAALAAKDCGVQLGHVEAGLRSGDPRQPWPEEENRIAIDAIADLLFAPTERAAINLAREGVPGRVWTTGNSGIDALFEMRRRLDAAPHLTGRLPRARLRGRRIILATCHRHENIGALPGICDALARLGARGDIEIMLPVHPNRTVQPAISAALRSARGVTLLPPLRYAAMVWLLDRCDLVLTDSGGLQEEAPAFGKPVLVMRNLTERQEGIESGNLRLVGTDADRIVAEASHVLDGGPEACPEMHRPAFPFGRGGTANAILDAAVRHVARPRLVAVGNDDPGERRSKVA